MSLLETVEHAVKGPIWDCRMCGQCVLHDTGLTCPMTCPKTLRNGPCGGVRPDGNCEVKPEMRCVWVKAYARADKLPVWGDAHPPPAPAGRQPPEGHVVVAQPRDRPGQADPGRMGGGRRCRALSAS